MLLNDPTIRVATRGSALAGLVVLSCASVSADVPSESVWTLDRFDDGGFWLFSDGMYVTIGSAADVPGGERILTFVNDDPNGSPMHDEIESTPTSLTADLEGILTLDDRAGTLSHETDGLGVFEVGYGYENSDGVSQPDFETPLNMDLSAYELLRIDIIENERPDRGLLFFVQFNTHGDSFQTSDDMLFSPNGLEGTFEIELAALPGDADFADIDSISISVLNAFTGFGFTLGGFEFVDIDPPRLCAGDCDKSGAVDFGDLVAMLGVFGSDTGDGCDADRSGAVDFGDLIMVLGLYGPCE